MPRLWMLAAIALAPFMACAAEYVENANSADAWKLETLPGHATLRSEDGALRADVSIAPPEQWQVQFYQEGKSLAKGRQYVVRFTAKASSPRPINIAGQMRDPPYASFWFRGGVQLTTSYQPYEFTFSSDRDTDGRGRLPMFIVGGAVGTVWIKDASVRDAGDKPTPTSARTSATSAPAAARQDEPAVVIPLAEPAQGMGKFQLEANAGAKAEMRSDGESDRIDIQQIGAEKWSVQIYRTRPELRPGRYGLVFSAKADRARTIDILPAQENADPYNHLTGTATVQVTTDWQKYLIRFEMPQTTKAIRTPVLMLGASTGTFWIKDCTIEAAH